MRLFWCAVRFEICWGWIIFTEYYQKENLSQFTKRQLYLAFSYQENIFSFAIWHDSGRNTITPGIHDAVTIMKSTRISKTISNVSVRTLCGHCILWSVHIASDFVQFPSRRWVNSISHNIFVIHTFCKFEIGNENRQRA